MHLYAIQRLAKQQSSSTTPVKFSAASTYANQQKLRHILYPAQTISEHSSQGKQQQSGTGAVIQRIPGNSSEYHEDYRPTRLITKAELLTFGGNQNWLHSLPRFTGKLSKNKGKKAKGGKARVEPSVSISKGGIETPTLDHLVVTEQARDDFEQQIDTNRAAFVPPTASGEFLLYRNKGGYAFRSASNQAFESGGKRPNEAFVTWLESRTITDVIDKPTAADKKIWKKFRKVAAGEGGTAAVNAWDKQTLTLGAGFTGARLIRVLNAMPIEYHRQLFAVGIAVTGSDLLIYDTGIHAITRGKNAFRVAAVTSQILAAFIQLAQSSQTATQDGESKELRLWMLMAQFEEFKKRTEKCPKIHTWGKQEQSAAEKLMHWLGAVSCKAIEKTEGDPQKMADVGARVIRKHWQSAGFASEQAGLDRLKNLFSKRGFTVTVQASSNAE
ncbi:hypothetical protein [Thalassomonas haliotis]|uniref:Uncharacterized protein n=1 Tax=Thalassomonas haliotis TaxID=485448 RepID=A0ABY7VML0_9GAMM|nr:hypothetical protein [Thalassomonas haliotis]WDE14216.1 hypothetical protein H3N35_12840 [Thalassomonas haliotis]